MYNVSMITNKKQFALIIALLVLAVILGVFVFVMDKNGITRTSVESSQVIVTGSDAVSQAAGNAVTVDPNAADPNIDAPNTADPASPSQAQTQTGETASADAETVSTGDAQTVDSAAVTPDSVGPEIVIFDSTDTTQAPAATDAQGQPAQTTATNPTSATTTTNPTSATTNDGVIELPFAPT